jgi:hypothetical protein
MSMDTLYKLDVTKVLLKNFSGGGVAFSLETNIPYELNETAFEIISLCKETISAEEIIEHLHEKYAVEKIEISKDVKNILDRFQKLKLTNKV